MTTPVYDSVAYLASDKFAVFNAAGDSFASEFAPGLRLRADCGTDGVLLGTAAAASYDSATGRTVVTTTMDGGAALTANLAAVLHGNDLPASLCAHAALHAPGGRDALPAASTGASGLVSLASAAETQAGASAAKAVTPAGLAASAKGLIATNATIYVATTGSDVTGTGFSSAPYASIAKALSSIAGKLIASGVIVTVQVADGTYTVSGPITVDHPDADKIQILGNISSETTVAVSAIDTTAKTITVAGNYVSNADASKNIQPGDIIGLTGSSTSGLNGAYVVSGVSSDGTNTIITCSGETFASAVVGGGTITIKPCNKCKIVTPSNGFYMSKGLLQVNGLTITNASKTSIGVYVFGNSYTAIGRNVIIYNFNEGLHVSRGSIVFISALICKTCTVALYADWNATCLQSPGTSIFDSCSFGVFVNGASFANILTGDVFRSVTTSCSPAVNTVGNNNSYIYQ